MDLVLNFLFIFIDQTMLFIINLLVARQAGPVLFGDYQVATEGLMVISTLLTMGIGSVLSYYIPKLYQQKQYHTILHLTQSLRFAIIPAYLSIFIALLLLTLCFLALVKIYSGFFLLNFIHPIYLFLWGTIFIATYTIYTYYFRTIHYLRTSIGLSFTRTSLYFIFSLIITFAIYPRLYDEPIYFPHLMLTGFILSYLVVALTALLLRQYLTVPKPRAIKTQEQPLSQDWKNKMFGYLLQDLNIYIFTAIPLFILEIIDTNEHSVGMFAAIFSIFEITKMGIRPFGVMMSTEISAALVSKKTLQQAMMKWLLLCLSLALIIIVLTEYYARAILLLYKSNFIDALTYLHVILLALPLYALTLPLQFMVQNSRNGHEIGAKIVLVLLIFQIILSSTLIYIWGLLGSILGFMVVSILYTCTFLYQANKIYRLEF